VESVQNLSASFAILGLVFAVWGSLTVFSSIRRALNNVWAAEEGRPWLQAKFVDLAQVGVVALVLLGSIVLTGVIRTARDASGDYLGPLAGRSPLWEIPTALLPAALTFTAFALLYHIVPVARPGWRSVLPGAALAALLFEALKISFAFYVANFSNYNVVYGSVGGLLLFLFYMFLASNILLLGAELVHTLSRFHAGAFADEIDPPVPLPPVSTRMYRAMRSLFVRG
jgi:membrane protein